MPGQDQIHCHIQHTLPFFATLSLKVLSIKRSPLHPDKLHLRTSRTPAWALTRPLPSTPATQKPEMPEMPETHHTPAVLQGGGQDQRWLPSLAGGGVSFHMSDLSVRRLFSLGLLMPGQDREMQQLRFWPQDALIMQELKFDAQDPISGQPPSQPPIP